MKVSIVTVYVVCIRGITHYMDPFQYEYALLSVQEFSM